MADDSSGTTLLAKFDSELDASIVAALLDGDGIPVTVIGGHTQAQLPVGALASVDLLVPDARVDEAIAVLKEAFRLEGATPLAVDRDGCCLRCGYSMSGIADADRCPECGLNLRRIAERLRIQRFMAGVPEGPGRAARGWGTLLAWVILVGLIAVPFLVGAAMTIGRHPLVAILCLTVPTLIVITAIRQARARG